MLLSRVLGVIGRFCIALGVLTLLFVAYQLWGTGILTAQAQNGLEDDFEELLAEAEELSSLAATPAVDEPADDVEPGESEDNTETGDDAGDGSTESGEAEAEGADPGDGLTDAQRELWSTLLWQPNGEAIARLSIPDIGSDWTVVAGVGTDELRNGPGHYPSTPLPGMPGNVGIAGHRTTWGAPFNRIDELEPGDIITAQTLQGVFEYRVIEQETGKGHFIVSPGRVDVLDQDFVESPNRLTLTACHPKFSARQRIIVVAELVGEPVPYIPRPGSLGEIGDTSLASEDGVDGAEGEGGVEAELPGDPDLQTTGDDGDDPAEADEPTDTAEADESNGGGDDDEAALLVADTGSAPSEPSASLQGALGAENFGQGLNGDRAAILPAIMWGLAATAIAAAAGFIGRRWKKWPSYVVALTPFALVLFACFVHIDQALPSY